MKPFFLDLKMRLTRIHCRFPAATLYKSLQKEVGEPFEFSVFQ